MRFFPFYAITALLIDVSPATASESVTLEPDGSSYHFVSHYTVEIEASPADVWSHLIDLESWMYEFDLSLETGERGQAGEVRRLYAGQEFFIEITKMIPGKLLVFANLPSSMNGEYSTGVAVITLSDIGGATEVNLTMSRRYSWDGTDPNPNKATRESAGFQENTRAMWQDRFLNRLRQLAKEP